ncbi:MAG: universal stress protein [Proteobacteria bacterium]|nr:universal stress protein [Desulfobacula sp.]MBU3951350.1 universal stress protein [Pseudomonadota bacterium]MBU4132175.1 universal stress protein [Pseudomonadota bacterium]
MKRQIKKILVAVDFSSYSKATLESAFEISRITKSQILAINIINQKEIESVEIAVNSKRPGSFLLTKHLSEEMGRRQLRLKALIKGILGMEKLSIKTLVGFGVPSVEILEAVDREDVDLLVFGPKGRTNLRMFLFGSVAEKLFRHCPVPVLSLRSQPE